MSPKALLGISVAVGFAIGGAVLRAIGGEFRGSPGMGGLAGAMVFAAYGGVLLLLLLAGAALAWEGRHRRFFLTIAGSALGGLIALALVGLWL